MPLFQKKENMTEEEKKLSVVTFWLFVVTLFAWAIPFSVLFVMGLMGQTIGGKSAFATAFTPSLISFIITAILSVIIYFAYKKFVVKL